jgi:replicative DNA helicase
VTENQVQEEEQPDYPIEYQLFSLSMREKGAIDYFIENLDTYEVGYIHGFKGFHEFYEALVSYADKTKLDIVDPVAFKTWLESETGIHQALGGSQGVDSLMSTLMSLELSEKEAVVKILKHKSAKRKQLDYLEELKFLVSNKGLKSDQQIERINQLVSLVQDIENSTDYNPLENVTTATQIVDRIDSLLDIPDFLPTQFKALNKAMGYTEEGGFFRGSVHAIIAPSGKGKSTFAKCLVNNWVNNGYRALYVNFEEAQSHWERILMTQVIGQNVYAHADKWNDEDRKKYTNIFKQKMLEWGDRLMVKHDPDTPYFEDLEKWLREIIGYGKDMPDVVVIDTIQSMFTRGKGKARWGEFEEMMVKLEKLARDMNCALIITAQENANRMKEKREVVQQSDTGGSLAIQQKCAVTIFITEKRLVSGDETEDENIMQLQIPKNRITGSTFVYDPPLVRYVDARKTYEDYEIVTEESYDSSSILDELINGGIFD